MSDLVSGIYPITFTATNSTGLTNSGSAVLNVGITDPYLIFNTVVSSSAVSSLVLSSGADTTLSFGTVVSSSNVSPLDLIVSGQPTELTFTTVSGVGGVSSLSLTSPTFSGSLSDADIGRIVDAIFSRIVEGTETFSDQIRLIRAEAAGKVAVSGNTVTFRDAADTTDRITATVDANGQRTSIVTDVS